MTTPVSTDSQAPVEVGPVIKGAELPRVTLIPVAAKTLQPSGQDQVVNIQDKLTITIPGGALSSPQELKVSSVQDAPGSPGSAWEQIAVYDITFDRQHDFGKMLTIELALEKSQNIAEGQPVAAAYWDEINGAWAIIPAHLDAQKNALA